MRRLVSAIAVAALAALALLAAGSGGEGGRRYSVELDTASGLVDGSDLKVGGVRAGVIDDLRIDRATNRALADIRIDRAGFDLRSDARCEIRPQSLLGEYFMDCEPGRSARRIPDGGRIPVAHTGATIPPDVVLDTLRRPYRERLRLVISGLGAAAAGNPGNLQAALRRALPAVRETDRVLALLARQRNDLRDLAADANEVVGALAGNRRDVARFVSAAGGAAASAASERERLEGGLRRLPGFLSAAGPTLNQLAATAARARPVVRTARLAAPDVDRLLAAVPPFAAAAGPALTRLGATAERGRPVIGPARASVAELTAPAAGLPELAANARVVLDHLNDRDNAVEANPGSPGGRGFTGLEAATQYILKQALAINTYDSNGHLLKGSLFASDCTLLREPKDLAADPARIDRCRSWLGPRQPGINAPDPTRGAAASDREPKRLPASALDFLLSP